MVGRPPRVVLLPDCCSWKACRCTGTESAGHSAGDKIERRWIEISFLTVRLGGLLVLAFLGPSPEKAVAFLAVQLAVFGFYMGFTFAPNHIGMPLVSAKLKLDFLRRQVLMSRNIRGGRLDVDLHGWSQLPDRTPFVPVDGPPPSAAEPNRSWPPTAPIKACRIPKRRLWRAYRSVIGYLNTVGLRGKDPFLCPMVAQRRAL